MRNQLILLWSFIALCQLDAQKLELEWNGQEADVFSFVESGVQRFSIEGHTASVTDRITFKIRGLDALTLYQGGGIGIGTLFPHSSAILDLNSSNRGILIPRMSSAQRLNIASPALGLMVFDQSTESFWYRKNSGWTELTGGVFGGGGNVILDNDGDTRVNAEDNNDDDAVRMHLGGTESLVLTRNKAMTWTKLEFPNNDQNIVIGENSLNLIGQPGWNYGNTVLGNSSLSDNDNGYDNIAIGNFSLRDNVSGYQNISIGVSSMLKNLGGHQNIAIGSNALLNNTFGERNLAAGFQALGESQTGNNNTALGWATLLNNVAGNNNTAVGSAALAQNTADENTAVGAQSLQNNTTGAYNSALGFNSLLNNSTGQLNTAVGFQSLQSNTTGEGNVGVGSSTLQDNTGSDNTAIGTVALANNTTGFQNVGIGHSALFQNEEGQFNAAIGASSMFQNNSGSQNTAAGTQSMYWNETGNQNAVVGFQALYNGTSASFNAALGYQALLQNNSVGNAAFGFQSLMNNAGYHNTSIGFAALRFNINGIQNTAIGARAGDNNTGNSNVFVGYDAGYNNNGSSNVFIGFEAGKNELGSNKLHIANNGVFSLIEGEFDNNTVTVNGTFQVSKLTAGGLSVGMEGAGGYAAQLTVPTFNNSGSGLKIIIPINETTRDNDFITFENSLGLAGRIEGFSLANGDWLPPNDITSDAYWCYVHDLYGFPETPLGLLANVANEAVATACTDGGVVYESINGDYAEWLEREDHTTDYGFGQVVGVKGGKISWITKGAEQILVVSLAPIMLGNMPDEKHAHNFEKVAFMGQVPVWVSGMAKSGDYLLPSGLENGTAIAVPENKIKLEDVPWIFGRVWSDGNDPKANLVTAVVGVKTPELAVLVNSITSKIQKENEDLKTEINQLQSKYSNLDERLNYLELMLGQQVNQSVVEKD